LILVLKREKRMESKKEVKLGQEVCFVERTHRGALEPIMLPVAGVGTAYFYLMVGAKRTAFHKQTWIEISESNYKSRCYSSIQEYNDGVEHEKLLEQIRKKFSGWAAGADLTLAQLRRISEIINEK
jgi:hypothetical protein